MDKNSLSKSFSLNISYIMSCQAQPGIKLPHLFLLCKRLAEQHRAQFRHSTAPGGVAPLTHSCLLCTHGCLGSTSPHPSETSRCQPAQWISQKKEKEHGLQKMQVCVCVLVSILQATTSVFFDLSIFLSPLSHTHILVSKRIQSRALQLKRGGWWWGEHGV